MPLIFLRDLIAVVVHGGGRRRMRAAASNADGCSGGRRGVMQVGKSDRANNFLLDFTVLSHVILKKC